jgi:hypothetical protein
MEQTDNPQSGAERSRIVQLEEHVGYAERAVEQLSEEVRLLNARVGELARRVGAIDARIGRMEPGRPSGGEPAGPESSA